jgi:phosphoglycerol transferase MdoB-like AlkP superfamily enzyme
LGVPDDYMFDYSIPVLNKLYDSGKPFFATLMTAYNHSPIIVPSYFKSRFQNDREQIVEYSDWSLNKFFKLCKQQEWFDNTLFVFIADHGAIVGEDMYDMPLSYHHIPLIIYDHKDQIPSKFEQIGGQIDVYPTILGLLNIPYTNTSLGIDLFKESRKFIYFSADDKIGCINQHYFYIYHTDKRECLFDLNIKDKSNCINNFQDLANEMKRYSFSMLQTTQWLIKNNKTGIKN